jgi:hypothetical protein
MSYIGVGNESDTLQITSGRPQWQVAAAAAAAGGGFGVTVDASIPADFTTIVEALASGNTVMTVIGDTVESANIDVGVSGLNIVMANSALLDMDTNKFLWSADGDLRIEGNGSIIYSYLVDDTLFDAAGNAGAPVIDGIRLNNNSSASGIITNATNASLSSCVVSGDLVLNGVRCSVVGCDLTADLILPYTSENNEVSSCQLNGAFTDNGSGNILSDIRIY